MKFGEYLEVIGRIWGWGESEVIGRVWGYWKDIENVWDYVEVIGIFI